jgi:hypothetical protein
MAFKLVLVVLVAVLKIQRQLPEVELLVKDLAGVTLVEMNLEAVEAQVR